MLAWLDKTKVRWSLIILSVMVLALCLGLLIWGAVILGTIGHNTNNLYTLYHWRITGGLLVGICSFIFIIIIVNLSYFLNYHLKTKEEWRTFYKRHFKKEAVEHVK